MNILFLVYHGFSEHSGISKKIEAQIKGLQDNGNKVYVCTYIVDKEGYRKRLVNSKTIINYGKGILAKCKKRYSYNSIIQYAKEQHINLVYVRSFHNANPFTIHLFKELNKSGINSIMEIPTYPYDAEYVGANWKARFNLYIDKLFRERLAKEMQAIVTFSNEVQIFGQRCICISNGIDFSSIPIRQVKYKNSNEIHLIGVAEVHYWHGYDRIIHGIGLYNQSPHETEVFFHIIGGIGPSEMHNSQHAPGFYELIQNYNIQNNIIFHGPKFGEELDELFNNMSFAIGSLGRHRCYIQSIKTLKNREYAARGIPFIYSEKDDDFETMPYILKAPADESPVDIVQIISFYKGLTTTPQKIRNSILHLSWQAQMNEIIKQLQDKPYA